MAASPEERAARYDPHPDYATMTERDHAVAVRTLVNNIEYFSPNFEGLVLGCIDADFCNQILILLHFSRSTRLSFLRTAQISKIADFFLQNFGRNFENCKNFPKKIC